MHTIKIESRTNLWSLSVGVDAVYRKTYEVKSTIIAISRHFHDGVQRHVQVGQFIWKEQK